MIAKTYEFIIDGKSKGREIMLGTSILMPEGFGHKDFGYLYGDTPDKIEYHHNHTKIYLSKKGKYANA